MSDLNEIEHHRHDMEPSRIYVKQATVTDSDIARQKRHTEKINKRD